MCYRDLQISGEVREELLDGGRMVYDDNGVEVFNFGKYKGMSVAEVLKKDPGYYSWILNSDFTLNTKAALTKIRLREMSNLITK